MLASVPSAGHAQIYPTRPVRLLVGFPPGAGPMSARAFLPIGSRKSGGSRSLSKTSLALAAISPLMLPRTPILTVTR